MTKLCVSGEVCLNSDWTLPEVCTILQKIQNLKFNDDSNIRIYYRDYILTLDGQGILPEMATLRKVITELNDYLTPNSFITISNSKGESRIRLSRDGQYEADSLDFVEAV